MYLAYFAALLLILAGCSPRVTPPADVVYDGQTPVFESPEGEEAPPPPSSDEEEITIRPLESEENKEGQPSEPKEEEVKKEKEEEKTTLEKPSDETTPQKGESKKKEGGGKLEKKDPKETKVKVEEESEGQFTLKRPVAGKIAHHYGETVEGEKLDGIIFDRKCQGSPILAAMSGKVVAAKVVPQHGKMVVIQKKTTGGDVYLAVYSYMGSISPKVKKGSRVQKGQEIGSVGNTELQFRVRHRAPSKKKLQPVDPSSYGVS